MLRQVHDVLGLDMRMHAYLDALYLLLFHRLPIQNCPPKLLRHLPTVRPLPQNRQARPALYQPMHLKLGNDQHESQRDGFATTKYHYQGQCLHKYRRVSLLPSHQLSVRLLPRTKLQRGHRRSHLCHS